MKDDIKKKLKEFHNKVFNSNYITSSDVIEILDAVCDELHLQQIYVCENAGSKNHYLYPYVSSKGPKANCMHKNLIVFPDSDIYHLSNMFINDPVQIFDENVSAARNATAPNNLVYGFLDKDVCLGFVSFQPYEDEEKRIWSEEDRDILRHLAFMIKPLITARQVFDRYAYEKNLKSSSSGIFFYYPSLSLCIVPEDTMDRFNIPNLVYRNAPESITNDLVNEGYREEVNNAVKAISKDNPSTNIVFQGKNKSNKFYRVSLTTNRYDDKDNPEEVMGLIEEINKEEYDSIHTSEVYKKYQVFREAISRSNLIEFYVNLKNGKVTLFKAIEPFSEIFASNDDFDTIINYFSEQYVSQLSRIAYKKVLNREYLFHNLNKYITLNSQVIINGEEHVYETTIVLYNQTIYNYSNEVMIFVRDVTHLESLNYDNLTGLYSLNYFINFLDNKKLALSHSPSSNLGSIIFFDILDFKYYNFGMGLKKGNEILKSFAHLLQETYPQSVIARYNDDRFLVYDEVMDGLEIERINSLVNKTLKLDSSYALKLKAGIYKPNLEEDPAAWVDYAQIGCNEIKHDLNTNYIIFDQELKNKIAKKNYIIDNVDKAVENEWIKIYFQPVIGTKDNRLVAMEALTRWIDPTYGFLPPNDFISVLENNNLLYKVDIYVMNKVCKKLREELDLGHEIVPISINLSRADFVTCHPFNEVEKAINKYHIERKYICIEITETITMSNPEFIKKAINQFREAGYEVWMDDFGSGYSSLNVLKDYPFDEIKIDMAFLKNFNEKAKSIISSTISMAQKLNIRTLTEGVETKEHYDFLKSVGCERIQGYYFSKPLPYDEVIDLMVEKNYFQK